MKDVDKRNKIIAIALVLGLIILGIVMAIVNNKGVDKVEISNLRKELPENAPSELLENIETSVYKQLEVDLSKNELPNIKGAVRDSSYFAFADHGNIRSGKFIVDMESVGQSYLVLYSYNADEKFTSNDLSGYNGITLYCLSNPEDIMYPGSSCEGKSMISSQDDLYLSLPPYQYKLDDGREVKISFSQGKEVTIIVNHCDTEIDEIPIIDKAKEWVEGYGFKASDFKYKVPLSYENCLMK